MFDEVEGLWSVEEGLEGFLVVLNGLLEIVDPEELHSLFAHSGVLDGHAFLLEELEGGEVLRLQLLGLLGVHLDINIIRAISLFEF